MDTIRALLGFIFRVVIALILISLVWWLVTTLFPELSLKRVFSTPSGQGWLPAPGSWSMTLGKPIPTNENTNVYKPAPAYNGYGNAYNNNAGGANVAFLTYTYDNNGKIETYSQPYQQPANNTQVNSTGYSDRSSFIRNLSIYDNARLYAGLPFTGEARDIMFKDGRFPIIVLDNTGKMITVTSASSTGAWSVPGWVRFQARIQSLPTNTIPCTLVFQSGNYTATQQPIRVSMPVTCN
jgi:hypothetical protein